MTACGYVLGKSSELHHKIISKRAADTAILQLHECFLANLPTTTMSHQICVDVHLGRVVDQHSYALPMVRVENVVE